jgi:hypothetical protein
MLSPPAVVSRQTWSPSSHAAAVTLVFNLIRERRS